MDDLMDRAGLIIARCQEHPPITPVADRWEAADVIDALRKEVERLLDALKPIAAQKTYFEYDDEEDPDELDWAYAMEEAVKLARAALNPKVDE